MQVFNYAWPNLTGSLGIIYCTQILCFESFDYKAQGKFRQYIKESSLNLFRKIHVICNWKICTSLNKNYISMHLYLMIYFIDMQYTVHYTVQCEVQYTVHYTVQGEVQYTVHYAV